MPAPTPTDRDDHRRFVLAAVMLSSVIAVMTVFFMLNASVFKPPPGTTGSERQRDTPAIDQPYGGAKPAHAGDPGGWQQLALLGLIVVAVGGGVALLVRTSRRARRARDAEVAAQAAESPQPPTPTPPPGMTPSVATTIPADADRSSQVSPVADSAD